MNWTATARYDLQPAPGSLALVHDFLSTAPAGRPRQTDLLSDLDSAQAWLDGAWASWTEAAGPADAPRPVLEESDLPHLQRLRDAIRRTIIERGGKQVDGPPPTPVRATLSAEMAPDGTVRLVSRGSGRKELTSLLLTEIYEAQLSDTWRRLKSCKNDKCRGTFYDRSRNNSGVWHDVHSCGNAANLRASRARRKQATSTV
jgi:predicted RNA-binding Zn ribbon-like protein